MKNRLLIIGTIPPPVGGVSVHVLRLIQHLDKANINYTFFDIKRVNLYYLIIQIIKYDIIHLHSSNPYFRFVISLFCFCLRKKMISTIHGNLGRFSKTGNFFDTFSLKLTCLPILINEGSFKKSIKININSILMSSFLPPIETCKLSDMINAQLNEFRGKYSHVFSTNASHLSYDLNRDEIYGIFFLVEYFKTNSKYGLVISDPSLEYISYFEKNKINLPKNILFITYEHDFYEVLKNTDIFVRATTTDGDAISIREALYLAKDVICTNVIDRPLGVNLFELNNAESFQRAIECILSKNKSSDFYFPQEDTFVRLLNIYNL